VVDPTDSGAIAGAIEEVLDDDALAKKLSDAGRARAQDFTWEATARGVLDAYGVVAA
jgi:glycogen(starch) synthase